MLRSIFAIVVGSVIALMVGWFNWTVLNLWEDAFKPMPPAVESAIVPMVPSQLGYGTWFFPGIDMQAMAKLPAGEQAKAFEAYSAVHEKGPVGLVMVSPGSVPMAPSTFGKAMNFNALGAIGVALVLCCCRGWLLSRWLRAHAATAPASELQHGLRVRGLAVRTRGSRNDAASLRWRASPME